MFLTTGAEQSAKVDRKTASNFLGYAQAVRTKRGLHHECYYESCTFEEVKEKLGKNERGVSTTVSICDSSLIFN